MAESAIEAENLKLHQQLVNAQLELDQMKYLTQRVAGLEAENRKLRTPPVHGMQSTIDVQCDKATRLANELFDSRAPTFVDAMVIAEVCLPALFLGGVYLAYKHSSFHSVATFSEAVFGFLVASAIFVVYMSSHYVGIVGEGLIDDFSAAAKQQQQQPQLAPASPRTNTGNSVDIAQPPVPAKSEPVATVNRKAPMAKHRAGSRAAERAKREIAMSEVEKHCHPEDCWLAIHGQVYDVSKWARFHPGGAVLLKFAGTDCTDQFEAFHRPRVARKLRHFHIGRLGSDAAPALACTTEYRALRKHLWETGQFEASLWYYVGRHVVIAALLACCLACIRYGGDSVAVVSVLGGICLGLTWQQAAFMAHDALHNGVHTPRRGGGFNLLGWVHGCVLFGTSASRWLDEHNVHHAITVRPREDPQFNYLPLWLIHVKELAVRVDGKRYTPDWLSRALIPYQHFTFLPLAVLLGRFNFYVDSIVHALRHRAYADLAGMALFWLWNGALFAAVPGGSGSSSWQRFLFILASHWTIGLLHVQLLVSHLATDAFTPSEERDLQFFQFQLRTSRNIDTQWYDGWLHGGLQYQIEHHLFPQLPRHRLGGLVAPVRAIAERHGIPYMSTGFCDAVGECLVDFKRLSAALATIDLS